MDRRKKFHITNYNTSVEKNDQKFWINTFTRTVSDTDIGLITHVRTNIFTEQEFLDFKHELETNSKTVFRIERKTFTGRCVWSKGYRCHHGTHNLKAVNPRKKTGYATVASVRQIFKE